VQGDEPFDLQTSSSVDSAANQEPPGAPSRKQRPVKTGNADDAAFIMKNASSVIIVPGYGMGRGPRLNTHCVKWPTP